MWWSLFFLPLCLFAGMGGSLDGYLRSQGFFLQPRNSYLNEGYITPRQKKQFAERLQLHLEIESILEIGLNAGHSAEVFFSSCPNLTRFLSFDINTHPYTQVAVEYLRGKYEERFAFIPGDSIVEVPRYANMSPGETFDLIYIDGNHNYFYVYQDIKNCKAFSHLRTRVWIDDYEEDVQKAVELLEKEGFLRVLAMYSSEDRFGVRKWAEFIYL